VAKCWFRPTTEEYPNLSIPVPVVQHSSFLPGPLNVRSYHLPSFFSAPGPQSSIDYLIFTRQTGPTGGSRPGPRFIGYSSICTISMSPTEDHSSFCLSGRTSTRDSPRCFSGKSCSARFLICIYPGTRRDICYSSSTFTYPCTIAPGLAGLSSSDPGNLTISRQEPSVFADASSHAAIFSGTRMTKMLAATAGNRCSSPSENQHMGCKASCPSAQLRLEKRFFCCLHGSATTCCFAALTCRVLVSRTSITSLPPSRPTSSSGHDPILFISCLCLANPRPFTYNLRSAGFWSGLVRFIRHTASWSSPVSTSSHYSVSSLCLHTFLACMLPMLCLRCYKSEFKGNPTMHK
jgi:hypothetical protein